MNFIDRWMIERQARQDAEGELDASEDGVVVALGERPEFNPTGNFRDRQIATVLANRAELEELRDDERRQEDALTRHPSVLLLALWIAITFVAEAFGNILLLKSLGIQGAARWLGAMGLSVGLIFFTRMLSPDGVDAAGTAKRGRGGLFVRLVYAVLVVALAVARIGGGAGADDEGIVMIVAELVVTIALVTFPGFLGDRFLRQLVPAWKATQELKITRRRIKRADRARNEADKHLGDVGRQQAQWDRDAAQRRAAYRAAHRRGRKGGRGQE